MIAEVGRRAEGLQSIRLPHQSAKRHCLRVVRIRRGRCCPHLTIMLAHGGIAERHNERRMLARIIAFFAGGEHWTRHHLLVFLLTFFR
uniref:Major facilitator superfamily (MFS) profile domain-containing protein n=1 Tax=Parascaris univalens TaxID=6257 RepID=A0A915C784_PARUN